MQQLVRAVADEHASDQEARQALMDLIVRVVDEMHFGLRQVDLDELQSLAHIWATVNNGVTPSEMALRLMPDPVEPPKPQASDEVA